MTMAEKKKDQQMRLAQLVHDLQTNECLCRARDYPGVTLDQLNQYVKKHGPLVNPVFGEQRAFFIDEGHFTPYRMVVYGNAIVSTKIAALIDDWAKWSVEISQGAFVLEQRTPTVRMPDITYTPRGANKNPSAHQTWTYRGEPFVPSFVVEIDELAGEGSKRQTLDRKMRREYFQHGVQLGWLIDPRPDYQIMYEYKINAAGEVDCDGVTTWRDLDGGDVLPGFTLNTTDLEMVLNQDPGSSSEDEVDFMCPERGCRKRFRSRGAWAAHAEWHRAERARQKYLANQS